MDGPGVRARAKPQGVDDQGQGAPGTFSHPPGIRRNAIPLMQRYSSLFAGLDRPAAARSAATSLSLTSVHFASISARSRRALISAMNASFSAVVGCVVTDGWATTDGGSWLWNRAFQASPVFKCSQIPAPAMPSSRTAHMPSHGNSQRVRGMGCRYSGRSRSIRPPRRPARIVAGV